MAPSFLDAPGTPGPGLPDCPLCSSRSLPRAPITACLSLCHVLMVKGSSLPSKLAANLSAPASPSPWMLRLWADFTGLGLGRNQGAEDTVMTRPDQPPSSCVLMEG